jgi:maltooligosyltrehalose trehalohydrolase
VSDLLGASRVGESAWSFLVWAPHHRRLSLRLYGADAAGVHDLKAAKSGYHSIVIDGLTEAPVYRYVTADGSELADPASRRQPEGVHGPSMGFDPGSFGWTDSGFQPPRRDQLVIYELHVGTFTASGTFDAACAELGRLAAVGITAVEPMPVAAFPGARNWGYDGVFPFCTQETYGGPEGFQRFVDACHAHGLAVVLDVVYNHLGPEGNVLDRFGPYFTDRHRTPWGPAVNFCEAGSDEVRRYFTENAVGWFRDFHVDGLRLDAVHAIVDPTASPFLRELNSAIDALAGELGRPLLMVAESADNDPQTVASRAAGGIGFDAQWNDDFHHALHTVLTGERDGYYADYGRLDQLARAITDGFVLQGEHSWHRGRRHGARARSVPADRLVVFAQNHDQIGNRPGGDRLTTVVPEPKALLAAAVTLLGPNIPLLFMGEEYGETAPFPFFVDHGDPDLLAAVRAGRAAEFGGDADVFDPADAATMRAAVLDGDRRDSAAGQTRQAAYRMLLAARRDHPVLAGPDALESQASAVGDLLLLTRRTARAVASVAFNFGAAEAQVRMERMAARWTLVIDSGMVGTGVPDRPQQVTAGAEVQLAGFGFFLYVGTPDDVAGGPA